MIYSQRSQTSVSKGPTLLLRPFSWSTQNSLKYRFLEVLRHNVAFCSYISKVSLFPFTFCFWEISHRSYFSQKVCLFGTLMTYCEHFLGELIRGETKMLTFIALIFRYQIANSMLIYFKAFCILSVLESFHRHYWFKKLFELLCGTINNT